MRAPDRTAAWAAALCAGALLLLAAAQAIAQPPGDPVKGAEVFDSNCSDCHALTGVHQGPSLIGVVGRTAGALPGYDYTVALKGSAIVWTPANLDRFLQGPGKMIPGTAMQVIVPDAAERRDLIAYLASLKPGS